MIARLFCKNKQVNLKNKPIIGNPIKAQMRFVGKLSKTKNNQVNQRQKQAGKSEKSKMSKFTQ